MHAHAHIHTHTTYNIYTHSPDSQRQYHEYLQIQMNETAAARDRRHTHHPSVLVHPSNCWQLCTTLYYKMLNIACSHTQTHTNTHPPTHTRIHAHMHTHTHTHTHNKHAVRLRHELTKLLLLQTQATHWHREHHEGTQCHERQRKSRELKTQINSLTKCPIYHPIERLMLMTIVFISYNYIPSSSSITQLYEWVPSDRQWWMFVWAAFAY